MKKMFILIGIIIAIGILYVGGFILYGTVTKYKPAAMEQVPVVAGRQPANNSRPIPDSVFTFMTWNIGYCGEGAETDFFYDSGVGVIAPERLVKKYTAGVYQTIKDNGDADFIFIQEADRKGKRSWNNDEVTGISSQLPDHNYAFAVNYDVKYLPFPLEPWKQSLGRIYGGILTLSKYTPTECTRVSLPNITDWPRRIFYLERCLMLQRYPLAGGKDLVVINTHFEAYDDGGVKRAEMAVTKKIMEAEYAKGNYVVLGGDWNIAPPDFNIHKWEKVKLLDVLYTLNNDPNYIPGWKYVYDGNTPSNRKNDHPFDETTFTTVIDYFFVSPNIEVEDVHGINAGFKYSDHNPVRMKIRLK
jgi:endonuclease/exonuclease/phosphatase family metal-dependent hydrolase